MLEKLFAEFPDLRFAPQVKEAVGVTFFLAKDITLHFISQPDQTKGLLMVTIGEPVVFRCQVSHSTFTQDVIQLKFFMTCIRHAGRMFT